MSNSKNYPPYFVEDYDKNFPKLEKVEDDIKEKEAKSFQDMNLKTDLLRGIYACGFKKPTAIQQMAIIPCLKVHNIISQASPRAGQTTMVSISILQQIDPAINNCQVLILVQTQALAEETQNIILALSNFMNLKCRLCIDDTDRRQNKSPLEKDTQIIVGTPGYVSFMIKRKHLKLDFIRIFVLDDVNEILTNGIHNKGYIYDISTVLPKNIKIISLSTKITHSVMDFTREFMKNRIVQLLTTKEEITLKENKQFYAFVEKPITNPRLATLCELCETLNFIQAVILCNRKHDVTYLVKEITRYNDNIYALYGELDDVKEIIERFKSGSSGILITTNNLVRRITIDLQNVSLVIIYELPMHRENYIRAISLGEISISLVSAMEKNILNELEQFYDARVKKLPKIEKQNKNFLSALKLRAKRNSNTSLENDLPEDHRNEDENSPTTEEFEPTSPIHYNLEEVFENFEDMNLREDLLRGIYFSNFEKPTDIQQRAIVPCIQGHDVITQAWPNTGRTVMSCISILQRINPTINDCQAIIVVPTRALAEELQKVMMALGNYMDFECQICIGGNKICHNIRQVQKQSAQVIVGTARRVLDLILHKCMKLDLIEVIVLDDVDKMFTKKFQGQCSKILELLPERVQIILLLTTMPQYVLKIGKQFMKNVVHISVKKEEKFIEGTKHYYVFVGKKSKGSKHHGRSETLCKLYKTWSTDITRIIIFCNERPQVDRLMDKMARCDETIYGLYDDIDQKIREKIIERFISGSFRILITTDVVRRMMEFQVSLIIIYDLPVCHEDYIHRINFGETVINLVTEKEKLMLDELAQFYNIQVEEMPKTWDQNEESLISNVLNDEESLISNEEESLISNEEESLISNVFNDEESSISNVLNDESEKTNDSKDDLSETGNRDETPPKIEENESCRFVSIAMVKHNSFEIEAVHSFENMNLKEELLRGIRVYGLKKPMHIQQLAIIPCTQQRRDVVVQSSRRTGKTVLLSIVALQQIDLTIDGCQVLIIAQNRILAENTLKIILTLGEFFDLKYHLCIGGTQVLHDKRRLEKSGAQIIVGTAGRVQYMIERKSIKFDSLKVFILDDAKESLSDRNGQPQQGHELFKFLPKNVQIILMSSELTNKVSTFRENFMKNPITFATMDDKIRLEGIEQYYVLVEKENLKLDALYDLFNTFDVTCAAIFCNTRHKVDWLAQNMILNGRAVFSMHGDMDQNEMEIMHHFRSDSRDILITTDHLSRRIDIQHYSWIINYEIPSDWKAYINRIDRGSPFVRKVVVVSFITAKDTEILNDVETFYNSRIIEISKTPNCTEAKLLNNFRFK